MKHAKSVDEYIKDAPKEVQAKLIELRAVIKEIVPEAVEKISYGMPTFTYKGGGLTAFSFFKNHIGLYLTPSILDANNNELKDYRTSTATMRFPHKENLPIALIKKLILARVKLHIDTERK